MWRSTKGMELAPDGAPPPAPPRSFLTERGELQDASKGIELRPRAPPLSRPLPPRTAGGRGELNCAPEGTLTRSLRLAPSPASGRGYKTSVPLRRFLCRSPSPAQFAGEGRGGGRLTTPRHPIRSSPPPAPHQPPPAVSGEVGRWCRPGGGRLGASRSAQIPALHPTSPSLFWGRCEPERAEGAPRNGPKRAEPRRYRLAPEGREVGRIWIRRRAEGVAARPPMAVSR